MNIDKYIDFNPVTISTDTSLADGIALMGQKLQNNTIKRIAIAKEQKFVGILTQGDVVRSVAQGIDLANTRVEGVMTQPVITFNLEQCQDPKSVLSCLQRHSIDYAPVLDDRQKLIGFVDSWSLARCWNIDRSDNDCPISEPENNSKSDTQSKSELELFFDLTPSLLCIAGLDGYFKRVNPAFSDLFGLTEAQLLTQPLINFIHPEDRAATVAEIEHLTAGKTSISWENRCLTKYGDSRWLLWTAKADVSTSIIYAAARDISDRKQMELQLHQERDFSDTTIDTVSALVVILDREGKIIRFNRTCEQITGYSFAEVKERLVWDLLIAPEEKETVKAVFKRLLMGQLPNQYENHWLTKDDGRHLISWSNTALFDTQGRVEFVIATGIDVTQQRQVWNRLEQQYRQTKLLAEVTRKIRMSIKIEDILQTAVTEVQQILACDRVMVVEIEPNNIAIPISESLLPELPPMLGYEIADPLLMGEYLTRYRQGEILAIDNLAEADISADIKRLLQQFEVQAKLVVPILSQNQLKGLLIAHQCYRPRSWQSDEIRLLTQLGDQIGVALSQAQLLDNLEEIVNRRTTELSIINYQLQAEVTEHQQTEVTLRENQQKLAGILDNADEAIISIDSRQHIQLFNQGAEKTFGYRADEVITKPLDILLPKAFCSIHRLHVSNFEHSAARSRKMADRNRNVYGRRKDGSEFPAEASVAKLQTKEGVLFTVMLKDITERQQAEAKLQASKSLLAKAEKIAKIGSWEYDRTTKTRSWSDELFNILGFDKNAPLPNCQEILERIHPEDRLLVRNILIEGHRQGKAWELNYRLVMPDGTIKYLESRGEPSLDSQGKVVRVLETIMDVSDRVHAEQSLQRSEEQLQLIADTLPILIAYVDKQKRYRYVNRTYETWFGKPCSSLIGLSMSELVGENNYRKMQPYIEVALSGKTVTFENQSQAANGSYYWMSATYIPDFDRHGEVKGFFSMVDDITERKAIDRMKSEFISIASHEMRTPLTSIHGVIKLLCAGRLGELSDQGRKMADMALRNSDRLVHLVSDILDLERMESGKDEITKTTCDSANLIQQAIDTVSSMAKERKVILESNSESIKFLGDHDRLTQTLINLLSNAIKFSPTKSKVTISAQLQEDYLRFSVEDRGRGIPANKLDSIFERFQQVDASDSRQKGGTGLGLAICRHIVEQHAGKIWVESIYGKGSIFYFAIPQSVSAI